MQTHPKTTKVLPNVVSPFWPAPSDLPTLFPLLSAYKAVTCDAGGTAVADHLLRLGCHSTAETLRAWARLATARVMRVIVEAQGAVGAFHIRVLIPRVAFSWETQGVETRHFRQVGPHVDPPWTRYIEPCVDSRLTHAIWNCAWIYH